MGNVGDDYSAAEFFSWVDCADYVHDQTCPNHRSHLRTLCPHGLMVTQVRAVLEYLAKKPNDAYGARRILHDTVCISCEFTAEKDRHARSTQSDAVTAIRRWKRQQ